MIIQHVLKGIAGIDENTALHILEGGIQSNWFRNRGSIDVREIPVRLTDRNLDWHQNHYDVADPLEGNEVFSAHTPFISTTAGSVERNNADDTNTPNPAWMEAVHFATRDFTVDGYVFYCYLWIVGKPAVGHQALSEELRELNIYPQYSPYQPEGEITAKVLIPPAQIERAEFWSALDGWNAVQNGQLPTIDPSRTLVNSLFIDPAQYNNVRQAV